MKAIILHAPGKYSLEHVKRPVCPDDGILLKVEFCGLCGSDLRTLRDGHKNVVLPAIIGHEVSGIIEETGKSYKGSFIPGNWLCAAPNVYCGKCRFCLAGRFDLCENLREIAQHWPGGFAEYMVIPAEALNLGVIRLLPSGLKPEYGCIAEPASSCISAQEKLNVGLGDSVLIIGTGPIGSIHICIAHARGASKIIVADIAPKRLEMCRAFGPDYCINTHETDVIKETRKLTDGVGADVVITANPVPITQSQALEAAAKGGRIAFFGGLPHNASKVELDTNLIHYKALTVIGTTGFAPKHHILALEMMRAGLIPGEKLVSQILPLDDFASGVEMAAEGRAMKVVFRME